jgi:CheY-specific phosphatase CheX
VSNVDFGSLLAPAAAAVLETMFFSELLGPGEQGEAGERSAELEARVPFSGEVSGVLGVSLSEQSARSLAASFLGEAEEELTSQQVCQVVCELSNMLCGWILTKIQSQRCFDLGTPELIDSTCEQPSGSPAVQQAFAVERGTLTICLYSSVLA